MDEFQIIRKRYGGNYIALLESQAKEIVIITPDLFWDLRCGFTDIILKGLKKGKTYTYIISDGEKEKVEDLFEIFSRNRTQIRGKVSIYLVPYPILFEVAIYNFINKPPIYLLVADRNAKCEAIDIKIYSSDYKAYIDRFIDLSKKNFTEVLIFPKF